MSCVKMVSIPMVRSRLLETTTLKLVEKLLQTELLHTPVYQTQGTDFK